MDPVTKLKLEARNFACREFRKKGIGAYRNYTFPANTTLIILDEVIDIVVEGMRKIQNGN